MDALLVDGDEIELTLRVKYEPSAESKVQLLELPEVTRVLWGRPRVTGEQRNVVEVTLMEGGTLGREHTTSLTRRLSSSAAAPGLTSQIDEELLFNIARGELALTESTDYQITHDSESGDFDDCVPGKCTAALPPYTGCKRKGVAKVSARGAVVGGLRMAHINEFVGTQIKLTRAGDPTGLNPRLMLGMLRLCRPLSLGSLGGLPIRTFITVGFGRSGEDRAHGNGRGVDFSGASTAHTPALVEGRDPKNTNPLDPNCSWPKSKQGRNIAQTIPCVAEQEFVVFYHWGLVQRLVRTANGTVERRPFGDRRTYQDLQKPNTSTETMLYSLSVLPTVAERRRGHELTDEHYVKAGVLFRAIYQFFCREFSQRDTELGPLAPKPSTPSSPPTKLELQWADDTASAIPEPGEVGGNTLHPDYPEPDLFDAAGKVVLNSDGGSKNPRRHSHLNHIHANVGSMSENKATFER